MKILEYLRNKVKVNWKTEDWHGMPVGIPQIDFKALKNDYGLTIKEYWEGVVDIFNYNQLNKPSDLANECRALVLSPYCNWQILSRGFDRFFNYGPGQDFDFANSLIMEKVDGSYVALFSNEGTWHWQTRGTLAEGQVTPECPYKSWNELILSTLKMTQEEFTAWAFEHLYDFYECATFIFELVSPWNRVVKPYREPALYCLGVRIFDSETGESEWLTPEEQAELFEGLPVKTPKIYKFSNYNEVIKGFESFDEMDEGVVCWNQKTGERVKLKRSQYLALHRLKDSSGYMSHKRAIEVVQQNELEEVLVYFPEYTSLLEDFAQKFETYAQKIENIYNEIKDIPEQKTFALQATKFPFSGILFAMRAGKITSVKTALSVINPDKLLKELQSV